MSSFSKTSSNDIKKLLNEYSRLSKKKTVFFFKKTDFLKLIQHFAEIGAYKQAIEVGNRAVAQFPDEVNLQTKVAEIYLHMGQTETALEVLDAALVHNPENYRLSMLRILGLMELELLEEAREGLQELLPLKNPIEASEVYFQLACIEQKEGFNFEAMYQTLATALLLHPQHHEAARLLELCIEMLENYEEAELLYHAIINEHPYAASAWFGLGCTLAAQDRAEEAAEAFEYVYIIEEDNTSAYWQRAEQLLKSGQPDVALDCLQDIKDSGKADSNTLIMLGNCFAQLGDTQAALEQYHLACAKSSENTEAIYRMGCCHLKVQDYLAAIKAFTQVLCLEPRSETAQAALGEAYVGLGNIDAAIECFSQAAGIAPDEEKYWLKLATTYMRAGLYEEALYEIELGQAHVPDYIALHYCHIACLFEMGKRAQARYELGVTLGKYFHQYHLLFEYSPALKQDADVVSEIAKYS